jgi:F-type H+-transporting ATPase subunit c
MAQKKTSFNERKYQMENLNPNTLVTVITILIAGISISVGTIVPTLMEGQAAAKALDGIARQPDAAPQIRTTMIIAMALLETTSIYVMLVVLVLLFANPLVERFFGG